eukprot:s162_g29.t2
MRPSLGEGQLQQLWVTFDTNADGGISREEFKKQLANVQASAIGGVTQPSSSQAGPAPSLKDICLRVSDALQRKVSSSMLAPAYAWTPIGPVNQRLLQPRTSVPPVLPSRLRGKAKTIGAAKDGGLEAKPTRQIFSLAWPAVLGASIDPLLSLLDTYWVSRCLGMLSLAALGPALNVEDWMFDILKTVQVPVRSLTSESAAAGRPKEVQETLSQALCFCWRVGLAVALLGSALSTCLLRLSSVEASSPLLEPAKAYLVPRLCGAPGLLTLIVLQAALSGAFRDTTAVLRLVLLGAGLNAVLTPLGVATLHGGTAGAAWATTAACYVSAVAAWILVARRPSSGAPWLPPPGQVFASAFLGKPSPNQSASSQKNWMALLKANAAMSVRTFSSLTTWLVACAIITKIGVAPRPWHSAAPLAAHTCMTKTFLMLLYLLYGFQLAAQVLVSADVVRGDPQRARKTAVHAIRLGMVVASFAALSLWLGHDFIASVLVRDETVTAAFATLVPPAMAMLLIYGVMWVADGVLYGLGEYVWTAKCTSYAGAAAVAVMLLLARRNVSAVEVWWSLNIMMAIRAIFGGQTSDALFDALAAGGQEVRWPDFRALFAQLEPSLSEGQLQQLWVTFDTNADGGISREEFKKQLANVEASAKAGATKTNVSEEVCSMVTAMLRREGKTQDELFDALASGRQDVTWSDFHALFAQLLPDLAESQLQELWQHFDKNGDGGVSREEFHRALGTVSKSAEEAAQDVCSRVVAALMREGKSVTELFDALAGTRSTVQSKDFADFFRVVEPSITHQQLELLWRTFDKDGDGSVTREEFQMGLQPGSVALAPPMPAGAMPDMQMQAPSDLSSALWAAMSEVAALRAPSAPRGSQALQQAVRQQLAAFDPTQTGVLDPAAFAKALRSYSPTLPDVALKVLWQQVCEADGTVQIDKLVSQILQTPEPPPPRSSLVKTGAPVTEAGGPLWSALRRIRPALHERGLRLTTAFQMARRRAAVALLLVVGLSTRLAFIPKAGRLSSCIGVHRCGSQVTTTATGSLMSLLGAPAAWAVTEGFEDYNKLAVKAAKPIIETPKPAGEAPNDAVQVIGGAGVLIVVALYLFAATVFSGGNRDNNTRDGRRI